MSDVQEEWHRAVARETMIEDLRQQIAEVRPHCAAAYAIWDKYATELVKLERALEELLARR